MAAEERTGDGLGAPAVDWFAITPHDTNSLSIKPRALYVSVAGDISVISSKGNTMTITVTVGYHPLRPEIVKSTGTTATGIYGLL